METNEGFMRIIGANRNTVLYSDDIGAIVCGAAIKDLKAQDFLDDDEIKIVWPYLSEQQRYDIVNLDELKGPSRS